MIADITNFRLSREDIIREAIHRCKKELYARAQPSVNYDELYEKYKGSKERVYERYYLSREEILYVVDKYIKVYNLGDKFKDHCDLIIDNMEKGTITDNYIDEKYDVNGRRTPGYRSYKDVPPLAKTIGPENAQKVIDFIEDRKDFYCTDQESQRFQFAIMMGDSPTSNPNTVIDYWKSKGIDIKIDPRKHNNDYFWDEENGYLEEDEE